MPDGVTVIGDFAFRDNTHLTKITIPDSVVSIEQMAFYGCTFLSDVSLPDGLISIGSCAFASCPRLTSLRIPSSVSTFCTDAFNLGETPSPLITLIVPKGSFAEQFCIGLGIQYINSD